MKNKVFYLFYPPDTLDAIEIPNRYADRNPEKLFPYIGTSEDDDMVCEMTNLLD